MNDIKKLLDELRANYRGIFNKIRYHDYRNGYIELILPRDYLTKDDYDKFDKICNEFNITFFSTPKGRFFKSTIVIFKDTDDVIYVVNKIKLKNIVLNTTLSDEQVDAIFDKFTELQDTIKNEDKQKLITKDILIKMLNEDGGLFYFLKKNLLINLEEGL